MLTLNAPRRNSVGCSPTEKISRRMVDAMKARMPWGLGSAMTMARETSRAVHSSPDQCGSRVPAETRPCYGGRPGRGLTAGSSVTSLALLGPGSLPGTGAATPVCTPVPPFPATLGVRSAIS